MTAEDEARRKEQHENHISTKTALQEEILKLKFELDKVLSVKIAA